MKKIIKYVSGRYIKLKYIKKTKLKTKLKTSAYLKGK